MRLIVSLCKSAVDRDKERLAKAVDERWEKRLQEGDPLFKGCLRDEVCWGGAAAASAGCKTCRALAAALDENIQSCHRKATMHFWFRQWVWVLLM